MDRQKCLIVDDEPVAREVVRTYCSHLPNLQVVGSCGNALEAKALLQTQDIDILFLDINMPVLDGIAFLRTLRNPPQVIFTTAYRDYAPDAFDLSACDYLLKPFSLERFIVAVDRALERLRAPRTMGAAARADDHVFVRAEGRIYKTPYDELLFTEARGNHTRVVTAKRTLLPLITFSSFTESLPVPLFLRVHRSFVINKSKIDHIEGNRVWIQGNEIPIGGSYREGFYRELGL